jgi:hypothetical protein
LPPNPGIGDLARYLPHIVTTGEFGNYSSILVIALVVVLNLLTYLVTTYTHELLTLPWYQSSLLALVAVALLAGFLYWIRRKSRQTFGLLKTLFGLSLAIWAVAEIRLERENLKGLALWVSLLLAVDFVISGLDDTFPEG